MSDERLHRLEGLLDVSRAAATLEQEPLLQRVVGAAREFTGSETAAVLQFDEHNRSLRFLAVPPECLDVLGSPAIPVHKSPVGRVIENRELLHIPALETDARFPSDAGSPLTSKTRSLLAVPIVLRGKALGVLETVNKHQADYTEEDGTVLETLAAIVAPAMGEALESRPRSAAAEPWELDRLKSDFIAITSHELRTPLGVILGHATYLRELLGERYREQFDVIIRNAARLKEIVESLGSMDNYHTGQARLRPKAVPISQIIAEVTGSFAGQAAERNITLQAQDSGEELMVEADPAKISIALSNLVKNALTFTDDGGHILIQTEALPGYVKVAVTDDGIGISEKDLPHIFDRFFQVETHLTRRHNGMGLGLSVAKVMIELHGGRIWVESQEGEGSTFSFLLPLRAPEGPTALLS